MHYSHQRLTVLSKLFWLKPIRTICVTPKIYPVTPQRDPELLLRTMQDLLQDLCTIVSWKSLLSLVPSTL